MALTEEQLEMRRTGIGGSDIGAVCGFSPYRDWQAEDVYLSKVGPPVVRREWRFYWGHEMESFLLRSAQDAPEWFTPAMPTLGVIAFPGTLRHREHAWCLATPDGVTYPKEGPPILLECKTAAVKRAEGWGNAGTGDVPAHYACQALWTMAVLRSNDVPVKETWFLVLFGSREPQRFVVPWVPEKAAWLLEQGERFWRENVLKRVPPTALKEVA